MKNRIKEILEEEVYNLFEDGEFDPLGHAGNESDDLKELGVDLTKDCVLGFSNSNSKLEWPYFSLPAGYTCPFATMCKNFPARWEGPVKGGKFKRPASWEKNVKPGPKAKFMCYAARAQGQYPGANLQAFKNLDLIRQFKTKEEIADLIIKSMRYNKIQDTDILRIHEAGDFFSQVYFDAWVEVAKKLTGTLFYAYTVSLPFWIARRGQIPSNFKLIASMDEENEQDVLNNDLRYSRMVRSVEEASELGLSIDVDDSIAWGSDEDFALLIHGPQPSGSEAAQDLKRNKDAGMYGKEGKLSQAKSKNQNKKDGLRTKLKKDLRNESIDFDWAEEIDPYEFIKKYYNSRAYDTKHMLGLMASDYAHIRSNKKNISSVVHRMGPPNGLDMSLLGKALIKYLKDNVSKIKRFMARFSYDGFNYDAGEFTHEVMKDIFRGRGHVIEDMKYWGVDGDQLGPLKEIDDEFGSNDVELQGHKSHDGFVFIHRNLHKPPYWSIKEGRSGRKVLGYDTDIWITDVTFKVQQGGKERVRKEMMKNVHAGVVGKIKESGGTYDTNGWKLVTYNPYKHDSFVEYETEKPIYNVSEAILKNTKEVWVR